MATLPRCELTGSPGSVSAVSPALTGWTNSGAGPSGTAPVAGDLVLIIGTVSTASQTVTKTAGTGTWTIEASDNNAGPGALTVWVACRIFDGTETAPTFGWATAGRVTWSMVAFAPAAGQTLSVDAWAASEIDTAASTTHTANAASASGTDTSVILSGAIANTGATNVVTFAGPTGWTAAAAATETASARAQSSGICYQASVSGTVTPGAQTIEGGATTTTATAANLYHVLIATSSGGTAHTATAALTVTPSFAAARTRGKFRTAALTVTPSLAAARKQGHARHAALTVTPSLAAARKQGHARHAALTVTPSFSAVPSLGLPAAAAFPGSPLGMAVDLNLGGWTAITGYVRQPIVITRGRPDESPACNPGTAPMMWNNGDGRFTARLATGPYYGLLGRNTPVRVSIPASGTYLRMEDDQVSGCSTPDVSALDITGTIDVRIDCAPSGYVPSVLASKWASGERSWALTLNGDGTLTFWWTTDGATIQSLQSTASVPPGETCMRVKLTASTGTAVFYTAAAGQINGTFTQLGSSVSTGGSTSIFNGTAAVAVGACAQFTADESSYSGLTGRVLEFEIINSSGSTVAHPVFDAQSAGTTSFTDSHSLTWTVSGTAEISGRNYRGHFEAASLPVEWDPTGHDIWTPVACAGLLRRMGQGTAAINSSMKRGILSSPGLVAYWPGEDLAGSTQIASATGGPPMIVTGGTGAGSGGSTTGADYAADSSWLCSNPLPTLAGSAWTGQVPAYAGGSIPAVVCRFLLTIPSGSAPANDTPIARVHCTGTVRDLTVYYTTGGGLRLAGWAAGGANVFDTGSVAFDVLGEQLWVSLELTPQAPSYIFTDYALRLRRPGVTAGQSTTGSYTSDYTGNAISVQVNPSNDITGCTVGHVSVQSGWVSVDSLYQQLDAWIGETAGSRFARLCGENGYQARIIGPPDVSVAMGPQSPDTLTDLLNECQTADMGMIFEPRQALALGYITQAALLNQAAAVTLDASLGYLDDFGWPTDDDQYTRNDWTITRGSGSVSGSSFQAVLNDGSNMSISSPINGGVGDYSDTETANVQYDSMLADQAWWRVHLGTVDEARYPTLTVDLANTALGATLTGEIAAADIGAFLAIENPPEWLPPDLIRQLAAGTVEQLGDFIWQVSWNAIPESPYETGIFDDAVYGRCDTDGSSLDGSYSATATSLSVATDAGLPVWTTEASDFPFGVGIAGEDMTVTNITGSSSPQTFTVIRSVNGVVKAQDDGAAVLEPSPVLAMI